MCAGAMQDKNEKEKQRNAEQMKYLKSEGDTRELSYGARMHKVVYISLRALTHMILNSTKQGERQQLCR